MHKNEVKRRRWRFRIVDHDLLRRELESAIQRRHGGSQNAAADAIRISQSQLNRIVNGRINWLTWKTFSALLKLVGSIQRPRFLKAILTPAADYALSAHEDWIAEQRSKLVRWIDDNPLTPLRHWWESTDVGSTESGTHGDVERTVRSVEREIRYFDAESALLTHLRQRYPKPFSDFDSFLQCHKHFSDRANLAFSHVVAPLLQYGASCGVELHWREIEDNGKLERYLSTAFASQKILLTRSPDVQRAQEFGERLGEATGDEDETKSTHTPYRW